MSTMSCRLTPLAWVVLVGLWACSEDNSANQGSSGNPTLTTATFGQSHSGEGTYYSATGDGACMFGPSPEAMDVAALNQPEWAGSGWCGACADVQGPGGTVRVRIVDLCPECNTGDLDLSAQAFSKLAPLAEGRVPITWTWVACDVSGPVRYQYKDGSNQWWTAVQVLNHRLPVTKLEFSTDGSNFNPTTRQDYNYFLAESGFGPNPLRVRITAVDGQTLEDSLPAVQALLVATGQAQFR